MYMGNVGHGIHIATLTTNLHQTIGIIDGNDHDTTMNIRE